MVTDEQFKAAVAKFYQENLIANRPLTMGEREQVCKMAGMTEEEMAKSPYLHPTEEMAKYSPLNDPADMYRS